MKHKGVYGIYFSDNHLLVVRKTRGPYIYRYDLPGGSIEENETLLDALSRELYEEIGVAFEIKSFICDRVYQVNWQEGELTHYSSYYHAKPLEEFSYDRVADDTEGYEMVAIDMLTQENASPLVLDAIVDFKGQLEYPKWKVLEKNI